MIKFFNEEEETLIIDSIRSAERNTSGEIRVHLEDKCKGDIMKKAIKTFKRLGMEKTKDRNGVLLFLAPERKEFVILGDEGINNIVGQHFWEEERDLMLSYFREEKFAEGIAAAIEQIGEKLRAHFPYQSDDQNELPDDISYK